MIFTGVYFWGEIHRRLRIYRWRHLKQTPLGPYTNYVDKHGGRGFVKCFRRVVKNLVYVVCVWPLLLKFNVKNEIFETVFKMQWRGNIYGFLRQSELNSLKKEKFHGFLTASIALAVLQSTFRP